MVRAVVRAETNLEGWAAVEEARGAEVDEGTPAIPPTEALL